MQTDLPDKSPSEHPEKPKFIKTLSLTAYGSDKGSLFVPQHGSRKSRMFLMSDSDLDLLTFCSLVASLGFSIGMAAGGLWAAAYWDVISVGVDNPAAAKAYMIVCAVVGALGFVSAIVSGIYVGTVRRRVRRETEFD